MLVGFSLLLLTACNPFIQNETENQFFIKKEKLFFMNHELLTWHNKTLPYCKQCSFNIHTKKMSSGSMLFRQINNKRGDLVFLFATNILQPFALQTGRGSYSIVTKVEQQKVVLSLNSQPPLMLVINQPQRLALEGYFVSLASIRNTALELVFWK